MLPQTTTTSVRYSRAKPDRLWKRTCQSGARSAPPRRPVSFAPYDSLGSPEFSIILKQYQRYPCCSGGQRPRYTYSEATERALHLSNDLSSSCHLRRCCSERRQHTHAISSSGEGRVKSGGGLLSLVRHVDSLSWSIFRRATSAKKWLRCIGSSSDRTVGFENSCSIARWQIYIRV